jgi:hypothetical protein
MIIRTPIHPHNMDVSAEILNVREADVCGVLA